MADDSAELKSLKAKQKGYQNQVNSYNSVKKKLESYKSDFEEYGCDPEYQQINPQKNITAGADTASFITVYNDAAQRYAHSGYTLVNELEAGINALNAAIQSVGDEISSTQSSANYYAGLVKQYTNSQ